MKHTPTLLVIKDKLGDWRWRILRGNGKILAASSEGFASKRNATRNFKAVKAAMALLSLVLMASCAQFGTTQKDYRYDPTTGKIVGKITTRASSSTLFSSQSNLTKWKATQSEKTQGAEVGGLSQQGATNTAATVSALAELLKAIKP